MVCSRKRKLALNCAIVLIIVPLLTTLQSNTSYAAENNRLKVYNIAKSVVASFTGGTISESEAKYKGAGQYMTVDEIKAAVEIEHKIAWEKAEAAHKAAWDQAEAEKKQADSEYTPKEYVGEDYSPLDYNEDTDWYNVENVEAIKSINLEMTSTYKYEEGKIVKYTDVDVTLVAAKLISQPTDKEITVTVDAPNGLCQGVRIDGKNVDPNTNKVSVAKDSATRSIGICVEFGKALSKVEINGNEITEIPADNEGWVTFEGIADADSYTIKLYENMVAVDTTQKEFVKRLYKVCLDRDPDQDGLNCWVDSLASEKSTGAEVVYGFIFSKEFCNKNLCNDDYIKQLYKAFMGRDYDVDGLAYWNEQLENGKTREEVFNGFSQSDEFKNHCSKYGILPGTPISIPQYGTIPTGECSICGKESGVTTFVKRMYKVCLDREAELDGLNYWCNDLWNHTKTGREVAFGFIFSEEFKAHNYNDSDYVEHLYSAFFGRHSDSEGKNYWLGQLSSGKTREEVFNGFVGSKEFSQLCSKYGIKRD